MTQIWNDMLAAVGRVARTAVLSRVALAVASAIVPAGVAMAVLAIQGSAPRHETPAPAARAARKYSELL